MDRYEKLVVAEHPLFGEKTANGSLGLLRGQNLPSSLLTGRTVEKQSRLCRCGIASWIVCNLKAR
jgi:hypothetical protein